VTDFYEVNVQGTIPSQLSGVTKSQTSSNFSLQSWYQNLKGYNVNSFRREALKNSI
jgi:hypothetical protein